MHDCMVTRYVTAFWMKVTQCVLSSFKFFPLVFFLSNHITSHFQLFHLLFPFCFVFVFFLFIFCFLVSIFDEIVSMNDDNALLFGEHKKMEIILRL